MRLTPALRHPARKSRPPHFSPPRALRLAATRPLNGSERAELGAMDASRRPRGEDPIPMKISAAMQMSSAKGAQRLEGAPAERDRRASAARHARDHPHRRAEEEARRAGEGAPRDVAREAPGLPCRAARVDGDDPGEGVARPRGDLAGSRRGAAHQRARHRGVRAPRRVRARGPGRSRALGRTRRRLLDATKMSDASIWSEMLAHRGTLCSALTLRFAKDAGLRDTVVAIRGTSRQLDVTRGLRQLLRAFEDAALAEWVTKLPKGEGPALARLRLLHAEWTRRRAQGATPVLTVADDDLMRRERSSRHRAAGARAPRRSLPHPRRRGTRRRLRPLSRAQQARGSRGADATKKTPVADPVSKPTG